MHFNNKNEMPSFKWVKQIPCIFLLPILFLGINTSLLAQTDLPSFRSPVKHTIRLSGTFGELRANHFHSGIDIKGAIGDPILAIEDAYISRIKVGAGGYGKVLYLTHPNGYTSVYAHLSKFAAPIDTFIKNYQYQNQTFEVEIHPSENQFVLKKGDQLGKMGMTGHAFGPHLHFEIRETKSGKALNPLLYGMNVADNRSPRLHQIKIYELSDKIETLSSKNYALRKSKHSKKYKVNKDTITTASNFIGVSIKAYDHMNGVNNWNGIYSIQAFSNDTLFFEFKLNAFAFSETRYINAHLDYEEQVTKKSFFNRCFRMPGSQLSIYKKMRNDGILHLRDDKAHKIKIIVKDIEGNAATSDFWVKRDKSKPVDSRASYNYFLPFDEENAIDNGSMRLHLPKGALYENLHLVFDAISENSDDIYSSTFHIHDYKTPVHKFYDLSIFPYKLPQHLKEKAFISYCPPKGKIINYGGKWEGKMLKTKVRDFGDFAVMVDTIAPKIKIHNFKSNMQGWKSISFTIEDNFNTAGKAKKLSYYATIDDEWILMELDAKKNRLLYTFDKKIGRGKHQFRLLVEDGMGNKSTFEREFVR